MTKEGKAELDAQTCQEFLEKLASLVNEYRAQVPNGMIVGAIEMVKFRTMFEANMAAERELKKGKP